MKSQRQYLMTTLVTLLLACGSGSVNADTCFDPNYGYYQCNNTYYYPDQGQAFATGAFFGMMLGGFANQGYYYNHNDYHHGHGHEGGWHHEGGGGHHR